MSHTDTELHQPFVQKTDTFLSRGVSCRGEGLQPTRLNFRVLHQGHVAHTAGRTSPARLRVVRFIHLVMMSCCFDVTNFMVWYDVVIMCYIPYTVCMYA